MKVALLSYYSGLIDRGGETFVHELANGLTKNKHTVTVYQGGPAPADAQYQVAQLTNVSEFPNLSRQTDCLIPLNGRLQAFKASIWAKLHKKKLIISAQSGIGIDDRLNAWCFPDAYVCLTTFQYHWAKKVNPFIRIENIPNGVDIQKFKPSVRPLATGLKSPIVLSVAALTTAKQLDLLIHAVSRLNNVSLLLVGDGPEKTNLEQLAKSLLPNRFQIRSLTYSQMPSIYTACTIFAFPTSAHESFGIAMLEALASGLAVVGSDDPIRKEIIGNAGLTISPHDTDKFAQAISIALRKDWGTLPQQQAKKFSWYAVSRDYSNLINNLCQ